MNVAEMDHPLLLNSLYKDPDLREGEIPLKASNLPYNDGCGRCNRALSASHIASNYTVPDRVWVITKQRSSQQFLETLDNCCRVFLPDYQDLEGLFYFLRSLTVLGNLRDAAIETLCRVVRYEFHEANEVLYCRGDISNSWYILLSGSTFVEGTMYLPYHCFGKRYGNTCRRTNECVVLEPSEMIAIDYPDIPPMIRLRTNSELMETGTISASTTLTSNRGHGGKTRERLLSDNSAQMALSSDGDLFTSSTSNLPCDRLSHGSDTSSGAFSAASDLPVSHRRDSTVDTDSEDEVDLTEDMPDGEESISASSCTFRDTVREFLDKDPMERTDDEIDYLLDYMQRLPAFAGYTQSVRRLFCQVMRFAYVKDAGFVVMSDGEELDSWSVIINGCVQIEFPDGEIDELHVGQSFGITQSMENLYHRGVMRTKTDDCQFIIVEKKDYYNILNQSENLTRKIEDENGELVMVIENRILDASGRRGPVVIKAVPERLISYLVEEHSMTDPYYIEDFLLTYRTFLPSSKDITEHLLHWCADPSLRDRATRIILLWVNSHFIDFESHPGMIGFLEDFKLSLESQKKTTQLKMLHTALDVKPHQRTIILTRSTREESLNFSILGGQDMGGFGVYVCDVKKGSRAEELGLRRGDQILQVNGVRFEHVIRARALDVLRRATHLSITVRVNLLGYWEMRTAPVASPRKHQHHRNSQGDLLAQNRLSSSDFDSMDYDSPLSTPTTGVQAVQGEAKKSFMTLNRPKSGIRKALMKMNIISKDLPRDDNSAFMPSISTDPTGASLLSSQKFSHSRSNPDLLTAPGEEPVTPKDLRPNMDFPEHVLKVYRADQTCKHLLVHKETTAREIVMLALAEFGITEMSQNFSLYQVSVEAQNVIIQRRLQDDIQGLAETIPLNARYYLKNLRLQETLVADDIAPDIWRESQISLLQLDSREIAAQLTLQDFAVFKQVEPTEYIDGIFGRCTLNSCSNLRQFEGLVNREMFWVITEVCMEPNITRRARILKMLIKIAKYCHEAKNLNSCFAILSGLNHGCVQRLKMTWEKVPQKHLKTFDTLSNLMDPSRNMSKYRHLLTKWSATPPVIPFYPIVRKDLTFLHEGNETSDGRLINFEKLRMMSKEIRLLKQYTSVPYDMCEIFDGACSRSSAIMTMHSQNTLSNQSRKNHGSRSLPSRKKISAGLSVSAKKLYEEAQMIRKVKQYWNNVKIVENEAELLEKSLQCEASLNHAKRLNSVPDPAAFPVNVPKFGQQSPQAVRKLMALSDSTKVRPHQNGNCRTAHHLPRSPATSPKPPMARHHHGRAQSELGSFGHSLRPPYTFAAMVPVDLSVESSSVTAMVGNMVALRKSQSGSITSTESTATNSLADSGMASTLDSLPSSVNSSPSLNRPASPVNLPHMTIPGPPQPPARTHRSSIPPPQLPPRDSSFARPHRPQRPPDYHSATQSRQKPFPVPIPANSLNQMTTNGMQGLRRPPHVELTSDSDGTASTV